MSADPVAAGVPPWFGAGELARWSGGVWERAVPARLRGVCRDSRAMMPESLYVALAGARHDGHDFVPAALAAGAAGAMVRRDWTPPPAAGAAPLLRVADTAAALAAAAAGYRREIAPFVTGVTGSAGKTTVKEWIAALLAARHPTAATLGNYNNAVGLPLSLLAMARETRFGVFEIGTGRPGELAPLCRILRPDAAVITTIGATHLEFFGSVAAVAEEKADLLRVLPASGFAVLDADSPHFGFLRRQTAARLVTVSLAGAESDYRVSDPDEVAGAFTLTERATGVSRSLRAVLPGRHQILNLALAVAAARACEVSWEQIAGALPRLPRPPMRWEEVRIGEVVVINDAYNASPPAMEAALRLFARQAAGRRRVLVLGEMRELGAGAGEAHAAVGAAVARLGGDLLVAVGRGGEWLAAAAERQGFKGEVARVEDAAAAGVLLAARARPGDRVLLKASRGVGLERALERWREQAGAAASAAARQGESGP
jgi:UDP-N-acetylmuramoyl-tripeptide--D-alanyl-D-alanine ligase